MSDTSFPHPSQTPLPAPSLELSQQPKSGFPRLLVGLGMAMVLVLGLSMAMIWQGLTMVRELNQQKTITALEASVTALQEKIKIAEIMADSISGIIAATPEDTPACSPSCLRTALASTAEIFEQNPQFNGLGLIIPVNDVFGNLERLENGNIILWLATTGDVGSQHDEGGTQSFLWTGKNFMPYFSDKTKGEINNEERARENLRRLRIQQVAAQNTQEGTWLWRNSSWMVKNQTSDSPWNIGYSKAVHDERGRLTGVFDVDLSPLAIQEVIENLQQNHGITLTLAKSEREARIIRADGIMELAERPEFASLIEAQQNATLQKGEDKKFHTDIVHLEGQRHWAATKSLPLQGNDDWLLIATQSVSWLDMLMNEQMVYILTIALILVAGGGVVLVFMIARLSRAQTMKNNADLEYLATHDDLTGLPNWNALDAHLKQTIAKAREEDTKIALLYLTLDRFKSINDSYGYLFGNKVLRCVGEMLSRLVREQDMVAYLSGSRFLILLDQLHHKDEAMRLTRQIMEGLKQPLFVQQREIHVAASIGASLYPAHGDTAPALINHADIAMHEAKKRGGDTYQFFTTEMGQRVQESLELEERLQDALAQNQLHLVYQPKVSLHDDKISSCEVLLRWTHPELGEISPARFIPIAESAGFIIPIGDWILKTACEQAKSWLDAGLQPISIAINLSMRQFVRRDVVKWVANILQQTGLPAHCLELELTESLMPQDMERIISIFERLSALGVKLSLDDFGTGYSNLSYLKRLHIDTLKIDQTFVRAALESSQDRAIIGAIVEMGHNLGSKVLAEGVETKAQLDFVRSQHCDEIQGYYFSPPVAPETYAIMLRDGIKLK